MIQANKPKPLNICTCWDSQCSALAFGQKSFLLSHEKLKTIVLLHTFEWLFYLIQLDWRHWDFLLIYQIAFLKTGIKMNFILVLWVWGVFVWRRSRHTHPGIIHLPTHLQDTKSKVLVADTSSSSSSDPTWTLPCWFSCCLESHQRLTRSVWHHLCYSPFLHFCPTRHPIIQGFQSSTCSGMGSSDQ